jgi:hypothetical protein
MLLLALMVASAAHAQFVAPGASIPVVANNPGLNNTYWRSDVNVVNLGDVQTEVVLLLQPEIVGGVQAFEPMVSDSIAISPRSQLTIRNVLQSVFGLTNRKGALSIFSTDGAPLTISSRIYTVGENQGSYGQNVEGVLVARTAWASGIAHDDFYRTNIGVYLPIAPIPGQPVFFTVRVFNNAAEEVASGTLRFNRAGVQQVSLADLGVGVLLDGYVEFECADVAATWYAYASRVDQVSGDAVFRQGRGRQGDLP